MRRAGLTRPAIKDPREDGKCTADSVMDAFSGGGRSGCAVNSFPVHLVVWRRPAVGKEPVLDTAADDLDVLQEYCKNTFHECQGIAALPRKMLWDNMYRSIRHVHERTFNIKKLR